MFIRVWETLGGLILYKYPFKGLPKVVEKRKRDEIFMVFKSWKTILFPSIHKPQKEKELALPFRSPCQRMRATYHKLEAGAWTARIRKRLENLKVRFILFVCEWFNFDIDPIAGIGVRFKIFELRCLAYSDLALLSFHYLRQLPKLL